MPNIQPLQNVPEPILQAYLGHTKSNEFYEVVYISSIRLDPRDMDEIVLVQVTVRMWVRDAMQAIDMLVLNPQHATVGKVGHELAVLSVISIGPVPGASGGGIDEASMLVEAADRESELFNRN